MTKSVTYTVSSREINISPEGRKVLSYTSYYISYFQNIYGRFHKLLLKTKKKQHLLIFFLNSRILTKFN